MILPIFGSFLVCQKCTLKLFYFFSKKFRTNLKATKSIDSAETQACVVF